MSEQIFENIWFLPDENRWSNMNLLAFRDMGKLIVRDNSLEFQGNKERVVITHIRRVTFGKQGRDFVNNWVKVEYGNGSTYSTAFFADGSSLGYGGFFGGTKRILDAVQKIVNPSLLSEYHTKGEEMKCYYHPEIEAVATCTVCGKAICQTCSVDVAGRITCQHCLSTGNVNRLQTQPSKPSNPLAIVSLILGILGLCGGIFFSIPAWIVGNIAQKQIAENPNQEGAQLANVGKMLGMIFTIIYGALVTCYLLFVIGTLILSLFQQGSY